MGEDKIEKIPGRRERKKQQTREALEATALGLFQRRGYDQTTIEDITDAVDVSSRTFFRYFDSKEAVLFGDWRSIVQRFYDLIISRPPDESPLTALYGAAQQLVEMNKEEEPRLLLIRNLAKRSRRIGDYERNVIYPEFERAVARALAQRMGVDPASDPKPNLIAAVAVAAWTAARRIWIESEGKRSMSELLREAFDFVAYPEEKKRGKSSGKKD